MQHIKRWAWAWLPAVLLLAAVVATLDPLSPSTRQALSDERADPREFKAGEVDQDAVAEAAGFRQYPVAWLGEEFRGYKLTSVTHENYSLPGTSIVVDRVILVYGTCDIATGQNSCIPPLALVTFAPATIPSAGGIPEEAKSTINSERGLTAAELSGNTVLWADGGVSIQVQSNQDLRAEIIESLRLANASVFGLDEIGPGESLAPLRNVRSPVSPGGPTPTGEAATPSPTQR